MNNFSGIKYKGAPTNYIGNYHLDINSQPKKGSKGKGKSFDNRRTGSVVDGLSSTTLPNNIQKAQNLKEKFMKHKEKQVN